MEAIVGKAMRDGQAYYCNKILPKGAEQLAHYLNRRFYSVFSTVFLMYFSCCLLLVMGSCCLFLILKMFWCYKTNQVQPKPE